MKKLDWERGILKLFLALTFATLPLRLIYSIVRSDPEGELIEIKS